MENSNSPRIQIKKKLNTRTVEDYSLGKLYKEISLKGNHTMFEVIQAECRAYIDYDLISTKENIKTDRINSILEVRDALQDHNYYLFDSTGLAQGGIYKVSLRVIFRDMNFPSGKAGIDFIKGLKIRGVDYSVYKGPGKMQLMRLPYTTKTGENRILKKLDDQNKPLELTSITEEEYGAWIISWGSAASVQVDSSEEDSGGEEPPETTPAEAQGGTTLQDMKSLFEDNLKKLMPNTRIIKLLPGTQANTQIISINSLQDKCSICKRIHTRNRNYILHFPGTNTFHLKCHDEDAKDKYKLLYSPPKARKKEKNASVRVDMGEFEEKDDLFSVMYKMCYDGMISGSFEENHIANIYIKFNSDRIKIINENGDSYVWDGKIWNLYSANTACTLIPDFFRSVNAQILDKLRSNFDNSEGPLGDYHLVVIKNFIIFCKHINKFSFLKNTYMFIQATNKEIYIRDNVFDTQPHLVGFTNGVYDLNANIFREYRKEDLMTRHTGYPYRKPLDQESKIFQEYIRKVMPHQDERKLLFKILSSALRGELLENFIMLSGNGRNSKDTLITSACKKVLGSDYYYEAPSSILTSNREKEINQSVANMHNKRLIIYSEPDRDKKINSEVVKSLTGGRILPARGIYEKDNQKINMGTHILLSNPGTEFNKIDDAVYNRLIMVPFRAMFRTQDKLSELPEETKYAYLADSYFKSEEFLETIKYALLEEMISHYGILREDKFTINDIPQTCQEMVKIYSEDCNEFAQWFQEFYEYVPDEKSFLTLSGIYDKFKCSNLWDNMNKAEKRKMNYKKFKEEISNNPTLRPFYFERRCINNKDYKNVLIKYQHREGENPQGTEDLGENFLEQIS